MSISISFDHFCKSPFWDPNITWNTIDPDFTDCFENTVLTWIPCAFLWLFLPLEVYFFRMSKSDRMPFNLYNTLKLLLICLLSIFVFVDSIFFLFIHQNSAPVYIVSSLSKLITFILFLCLTYANMRCGIRSSGILFLFSLILVICGAPKYRTDIQNRHNLPILPFLSYLIQYPLTIAVMLLNCLSDARPTGCKYTIPKNVCPENHSSFVSRILFVWFDQLALKGYRKPLENDDLWNLDPCNSSTSIADKFEKSWCRTLKKSKRLFKNRSHYDGEELATVRANNVINDEYESTNLNKVVSVLKPLYYTFGKAFLFGSLLKLIEVALSFISPLILGLLIEFVNGDEPAWRGYFYTFSLFGVAVLQTLLLSQYFYRVFTIGIRIRAALITAVYKKSLIISNGAKRNFTFGEIVNLMSVDAQRIRDSMTNIHILWSAPLQIMLALFFLWQLLGVSILAGLAVMIILIPVNGYLTSRIETLQMKQMKNKDNRIRLMNEIISGIKILKLYAWEPTFEKRILNIRNKEIRVLKDQTYLIAVGSFVWTCTPFLVSLISFGVFVLSSEKNVLDAKTAFVSLSLFNILRLPLTALPMTVSELVQTRVSVNRINKFLNSEDLDPNAVLHENKSQPVIIENGTFSWEGTTEYPVLRNINVKINSGNLVAVVGSVGAGKSSLISAFLGEMNKISGTVNTCGTVAFVPQQAWIVNASFRHNITFGKPIRDNFYESVLAACALDADLEILSAGDLTEIGERGINLSGGQKQRISLARAIFSEADIYFLDDPLSAVDSHVAKHIFHHVIGPKGLLKNKTRVLVTHGVVHLSHCDNIIVLKNGSISEAGTFKELTERNGDFAEFLLTYLNENNVDLNEECLEKENITGEIIREQLPSRPNETDSVHFSSGEWSTSQIDETCMNKKEISQDIIGQKLIQIEGSETGSVKWHVYAYYLGFIGAFLCIATIVMNLAFQGFSIGSNFWLSSWSSHNSAVKNGTQDLSSKNTYLGVYAGLGLFQGISVCLADALIRLGCLKSAKYLHNNLLYNVLRFPLAFMDITPVGRILSRFTQDIDVLDNILPNKLTEFVRCLGEVSSTLFVISYSTPVFVGTILPVGAIYFFVQRFYVATSRQLRRLESVSRSPIYSHFGETVNGAQSIRAYELQNKFIQQSKIKVDLNQNPSYLGMVSNRWLSVRLETVGNIIIFFAALFAVLQRKTLSAGLVGLSVSYAMQITQSLNWLVRMTSELETNIVAVERIKEYSQSPREVAWEIQNQSVPAEWPENGEISFNDFQVRYREGLELVLKGLTFTIKGGEKIGVVGRTGAGKSSLTLSLFRIIEATGGNIIIDGIDISTLGLHILRSRITIIPQDPVLFSGTLRINLDPIGSHSDESIWRVLELAHLKTFVSNLNYGLQYKVTEGGENFSVGQRQLICLARALLRKTKVLVLDEATAAVDLETDDLIQKTIRSEFKNSTVLTIAHRLNTIIDYDRIIVLDRGTVVEYDAPTELLKSKNSMFYGMAAEAGLI